MPLRFRSVIPYTLPGVLALIGCWWYISRKKERISGHDSPEGAPPAIDFLSSPSEGSNGLVERVSCASPLHGGASDAPAKEAPGQVQALETKASPAPPHSPAAAAETPPPHAIHTSSQDTPGAASSGPPSADGCSALPAPERRDLTAARGRPAAALFDGPAARHRADVAAEATAAAALSCRSAPARCYTSPASEHLCSDAERPEPEGEVASQAVTVQCRTPPLKDLRDTTAATTKDVLLPPRGPVQNVAGPEVEPQEAAASPQVSHLHHHALTGTSTSPGPAHSPAPDSALASEDDSQLPQRPVVVDDDDKREFELLAAGLITEVISAATLEVLGDDSPGDRCPDAGPSGSSTPRANGRPLHRLPRTPPLFLQEGASPVSCGSGEELQLGLPNGFSPCRPGEVGAQVGGVRSSSHRPPPLSPGEPEGDSACCSTCHYGDGSEALQSSLGDLHRGDLHHEDLHRGELQEDLQAGLVLGGEASRAETPPQEEEEASEALAAENAVHTVFDLKRFNGVGLGNGIGEVETDQSGGSDVNSMDSVDSGCTMGPGETTSATSSGLELVVWEVEVPKHLVGRLIGKQGRYVSFLKQNSGAKIYISTLPYTQEFQICHVEGTQQQVDKALSLIGKKFKDLDLTNLYAPPPPTLPSLPMTSWLLLPSGVTVEVIVVNIVSAGHVFVQQHTHPTYHALRSLDQQMFLCYSQPGTPGLPSPAEVGVICAAPAQEGAWWRSQVITFYKEANEVEIRYVDYGGYDRVKIDSLRQIRSDFVTLPFQGAEVLLDNIAPLPGEDRFSTEATSALEEITRGVALLAQVSNYDNNTGLPLVQLWNMAGDELISVNRTLVERGLGTWVDSF